LAKILIIDDDSALVEQLQGHLQALGYQCKSAASGTMGWNYIVNEEVHAVILDVMLPGLSGFEICRKIRSDDRLCSLPILLMSSMSDPEEIQHGLAQGADDFVSKPFRLDTLSARLINLLSNSSLTNQLFDELTQLAGAKGIKLEVQKRISQKQSFGVAYVELLGLNGLTHHAGNESRGKAVEFMARGLKACGNKLNSDAFYLGHMGGGHFCALMSTHEIDHFSQFLHRFWERYKTDFYSFVGLGTEYEMSQSDNEAVKRLPTCEPMCCLALCSGQANQSFRELFETLSHVRANAQSTPGGGIYHDRRGFNELRRNNVNLNANSSQEQT